MVAHGLAQVDGLERTGHETARLLRDLSRLARPGLTTAALDAYAADYITRIGREPVFQTSGFTGLRGLQ